MSTILLSMTSACATSPGPKPTSTVSPRPLADGQIALTFERCQRPTGPIDCQKVAGLAAVADPEANAVWIECLATSSNGRIVYVEDAPIGEGLWLDISRPTTAAPSTDGSSRVNMIAALYKGGGNYVNGFQYNFGEMPASKQHVCDSIVLDVLAASVLPN
jgi:hypothetical protein